MADNQTWINGRLLPSGAAAVSPRDRGFLLGDGLFETILVRDGRPVRWPAHLARLRAGCRALLIDPPWNDAALEAAVTDTLRANALEQAAVRMTLSRGVAHQRGLVVSPESVPTLVIEAWPFDGYPAAVYAQGMRIITSPRVVRSGRMPFARFKTLSNLGNVLARHEAQLAGADEALVRNEHGSYAGASAANLFALIDGTLITPPLSHGAVAGTVRACLLLDALPRLGIPSRVAPLTRADLAKAAELLLTNALLGVAPVVEIDNQPVATGRPGSLAGALRAALDG